MQGKVVGPPVREASSTMYQFEGPRISSLPELKKVLLSENPVRSAGVA